MSTSNAFILALALALAAIATAASIAPDAFRCDSACVSSMVDSNAFP